MGVIPIVNENDTISVSEIKFGDNDTLSAITSTMIHADYLFLLTDVDGLYTSNPRKDPAAKLIKVVASVAAIRKEVSVATLGSSLGTGGMETKLIAADIATAAGVTTIITSSKQPKSIFDIIEYHNAIRASLSGEEHEDTAADAAVPHRPPHTVFLPSATPLRDLKAWTSHTLSPAGAVTIDAGAHHVLARRDSGGRLLAAGVLAVHGAFASGQAVRIFVRRGAGAGVSAEVARAAQEQYIAGLEDTRPPTPTIQPVSSLSSSIVSLGMLEREPPEGEQTPHVHTQALPDDTGAFSVITYDGEEDVDALETVEVGRGLANYNSVQIARVKGLNSSYISQLLGYADSEYVVENITIRVPPL